jgi:hypothetical protein
MDKLTINQLPAAKLRGQRVFIRIDVAVSPSFFVSLSLGEILGRQELPEACLWLLETIAGSLLAMRLNRTIDLESDDRNAVDELDIVQPTFRLQLSYQGVDWASLVGPGG